MSATTTRGTQCGNCKQYHSGAAEVKACYMGQTETDQVFDSIAATLPAAMRTPASYPLHKEAYDPVKGDVHFLDGLYYRVHSAQGTGNKYACVWDATEKFVYARGMIRRLSKRTIVTAEQAKAFGDMTERCCFCSTKIDTPESTAVGYGPICAGKHGLPWG